jgi:cbb3-type cytochrome oxidase maturation protein
LAHKKTSQLSALFILIGISIVVAGCFLAAFLWSVKTGQYNDDYTPSVRMLFDDAKATHAPDTNKNSTKNQKLKDAGRKISL